MCCGVLHASWIDHLKQLCCSEKLGSFHPKELTQTSHLILFLESNTGKFSDNLEYTESFGQNMFSELMFVLFQWDIREQVYSRASVLVQAQSRGESLLQGLSSQENTDDSQMIFLQLDFLYSTTLWLRPTLSNSCPFLLGTCSEFWGLGMLNFV